MVFSTVVPFKGRRPPPDPQPRRDADAEALGVQREVLAARLQRHVAHGFLRLVEDRGQAQQLLGILGEMIP